MRGAAALLCLALLGQPPVPSPDEDAVRAAVQQYFDAQARKDPDAALAFWSAAANPRPTREAFAAVFGDGEDQFVVEIQRVVIQGAEARVRVMAVRTRLTMREGTTSTMRTALRNAQLWRKEAAAWKLLRDGPFADEIADELIAASPGNRPALFEQHHADLVQARLAISQRATMAITLGRDYVRGKALFELALEVSRFARDRPGELNSLHNIAQAAYFLADHRTATEFYDKELALGRELDDQDAIAAASFGLATVAYTRGEYTAALGFYREALTVYEKRDHGSAIGRAVVSIGNVQFLQADYDAATASYRRGLGVLLENHDAQGASLARSGLARVYAAQGDLASALDTYGQVLTDARARLAADARLKSEVAATLESIGEVYFRLGNTDQARTNVEEARQLSGTGIGDPGVLGRLSATIGLIELFAGRFDAALAGYTESRTRFEQAKVPEGVARAWVGVGFSHAAREKWKEAMTAYQTAIRIFDEQKMEEGAARAWLGLSMAQSGALDHTAALESARKVAATAIKVQSEDLAWRAAVRSGEALRKLVRLDAARAEFERAIVSIDRLAADLPINPEAREQLDDSASAWTGLAMTLAARNDARGALAAAEARRAHVRRVQLAAFQRDIARGMSPGEQADEQAIVRELISTRAQLRAERNARRPDAARLEKLQQQLASLVSRRTEQQTRLYARMPDLQEWRGLRAPTADDVGALGPDGKPILVEYLLGDDELLVLTVAPSETGPEIAAALVPIERRKFADQITEAMKPAVLQDAAEWQKQIAPIATALLTPVAARLNGRDRCVIVPDDLLWKIPFEALPLGDSSLAANVRVTYATSLATLGAQRRIASAQVPAQRVTAAVLAAPAVPETIRAQITLTQPAWKEPDTETTHAAAGVLSALYGEAATLSALADATETAARAAFETADIVHASTPLQVSGATPLFSFLAFGKSGDSPQADGRWEVRDWFGSAARARVLVLTDASSLGSAGAAAALDTIAWAATAAGVPALVVARAPVDGFSLDGLLTAFHAALAKGSAVHEAWAGALAAAREKAGAAPAGWSGARLIGASR
jgi:tetratricopeptide (TPR) repeat protein